MLITGPKVSFHLSRYGGRAHAKLPADFGSIQSFFDESKDLISFSMALALIGLGNLKVEVKKL